MSTAQDIGDPQVQALERWILPTVYSTSTRLGQRKSTGSILMDRGHTSESTVTLRMEDNGTFMVRKELAF
jgi:hypothetical protein